MRSNKRLGLRERKARKRHKRSLIYMESWHDGISEYARFKDGRKKSGKIRFLHVPKKAHSEKVLSVEDAEITAKACAGVIP